MTFALGHPVVGEHFFGRRRELAEILSLLQAGAAVNFYSLRRMGKSSLLRQIDYLSKHDANWQHLHDAYVDSWGSAGRSFRHVILRELTESRSRRSWGRERFRLGEADPWEEIRRHTGEDEGKTVLLLDEMDAWLTEGGHGNDFRELRALQQAGYLNLVVSTAYGPILDKMETGDFRSGSPFFNIFTVFRLRFYAR